MTDPEATTTTDASSSSKDKEKSSSRKSYFAKITKSMDSVSKFSTIPTGVQPRHVTPENKPWFLLMAADWQSKTKSPLLSVPTSGDGKIADQPKVFGPYKFANINYGDHVDLTDSHAKSLTTKQLEGFAAWVHGGNDPTLEPSANRVQYTIDTSTDDNNGLVNTQRMLQRKAEDMFANYLRSLIIPEDFMQFQLQKGDFTYTHEHDPSETTSSGLILWSMILKVLQPIEEVNITSLENQLEALTLAEHNNNWQLYISAVQDKLKQINAVSKEEYCTRKVATSVFEQALTVDNDKWRNEVYHTERLHSQGKIKLPAAFALLSTMYTNMSTLGTWGQISKKSQQIIALTTSLNTVESKLQKALAAGQDTKKPGTKPSGGKPSGANPPPTKKKGGGGAPQWQITKVGNKLKHPDKDIDMIWCPHHKSADGKVNGMYMPFPHNHDEWAAKKAAAKAAYKQRGKRKNDGAHKDDTTSIKKAGSINNNATKLALSETIKTALMTRCCITENDLNDVIKDAEKMEQDNTQSKE